MSRHLAWVEFLVRFYGVGVINLLFGYGLFSALIYVGLNFFIAQVVAHLVGMLFNFLTFRRHVFRGSQGSITKYVAAYGLNYLTGLALASLLRSFVNSPYLVGLLALVGASLLNMIVLKYAVFSKPEPGS